MKADNLDSSVGIATWLRPEDRKKKWFDFRVRAKVFLFTKAWDRVRGPPRLLFKGHQGSLSEGKTVGCRVLKLDIYLHTVPRSRSTKLKRSVCLDPEDGGGKLLRNVRNYQSTQRYNQGNRIFMGSAVRTSSLTEKRRLFSTYVFEKPCHF